jgi:hypothetical protein
MLLIAVTSSAALALGAPAVASARHGSRHHHARHHARRARVLFFGTAPAGSSSGTAGGSDASPARPSASSESSTGEDAGKVRSFEGGVLTIALSDGTTVSGKVTERTELECESATPTATTSSEDDHEDSRAEGSHEDGGGSSAETSREDGGDSDDGSGDDASGESPSCTTAALTPETVVREAELRVGSSGAEWEKVDLLLE